MPRSSEIERLVATALFDELSEAEARELGELIRTGKIDARELEEMKSVLQLTARRERPEPSVWYWANYYDRLSNRIEAESARGDLPARLAAFLGEIRHSLSPRARLAVQLVVAGSLLVLGVMLGRSVFAPAVEGGTGAPIAGLGAESGVEIDGVASVTDRTAAYLGRSKTLLLGIVNQDPDDPGTMNLPRKREIARHLVRTSAELKVDLDAPDMRRLQELVSDIEMILIQIANLEARHDLPAIEMVQRGVERKALLFKINVEEMRRLADSHPEGEEIAGRSM